MVGIYKKEELSSKVTTVRQAERHAACDGICKTWRGHDFYSLLRDNSLISLPA
uniref:Uncharacterized protein n=1 Tax=Rhizophora mucronata TaxID=61149 RepID=A0A2P2N0J7_RHIMU